MLIAEGRPLAECARAASAVAALKCTRLGSRPGLGFYVMDEDPKGTPEKFNPKMVLLTKYYGNMPMAAAPKAAAPGAKPNPEAEAEAKMYEDPVTGEDMRTDWRFDVGFNWADALLDLAEVLRRSGRPDEAQVVAAEAKRLYEEKGNAIAAARAAASIDALSVSC